MFTSEQRSSVLAHWSATIQRPPREDCVTGRLVIGLVDPGVAVRTTPVGSGFSGGTVYRVDAFDHASSSNSELLGSWALKAWPPTTPAQQITRIAAIVRAAAPHCCLLAPPLPRDDHDATGHDQTSLSACGRYWELARWIPGSPLAANASAESIERGGEAIARVHQAMNRGNQPGPLADSAGNRSAPRCVIDRIRRINSLAPQIQRIAREMPSQDELAMRLATQLMTQQSGDSASELDCGELAKTLRQAAAWLVRQWPIVTPRLVQRLHHHRLDRENLTSGWVLRDVHREHVLFSDNVTVAGILDYDAIDWDSPAADLARWAGDFDPVPPAIDQAADPPEQSPLHAAVAGYRRIRPFSESEWDLAQTLVTFGRVGGVANWLVWLIAEIRQFTATAQQLKSRISHLIASDCRIC